MNKNNNNKLLSLLFFLWMSNVAFAQIFWTENFGVGCSTGQLANNFNPSGNGNWTVTNTGTNQTNSNTWFISAAEAGMGVGNCGDGCTGSNSRTLHLGSNLASFGLVDLGASYLAGFISNTDKRAESPTIDCTGKVNITLSFNYLAEGIPNVDFCRLFYFDGTTWNLLGAMNPTNNALCDPQGLWTAFSIALPAAANNNPNVRIGFRWVNTDPTGADPSFAVDDITLSAPSTANTITTGTITGSPFCACAQISVPFTSTGTFNAGNIFTAQLSNAAGSFAAPTSIGTLNSTANTGTITATIPCNTPAGTQYRIRVIASNPATVGTSNSVNITINANPTVSVNSPSICSGQTAALTANGATSYVWSAGANSTGVSTASASPTSTTTFTVTGTTSGCSSTATSTVTVVATPTVTVNSPTICAGQTANLIANGAATYIWSPGVTPTGINTANASPASTQTFTVTGSTVGNTCSASAVATVNVGASLGVTVNSPTICSGQTASLIANGATSYVWSAGATTTGTNTADVSPASTSTFTVTGTTAGCTGTATATVTVSSSLNVTVNSPTICNGQTANLIANGATSYVWSAGATTTGTNTADVSPASTSTFTVTGTTGGCTGTATATVTVTSGLTITVNSPSICVGQTANLVANGATSYSWSAGATTTGTNTADASPSATSTFTVTGNTAGCAGSAVATVTVTNPPIVTVNSPSICSGQTAALTANGANTYTWSAGITPIGANTASASPSASTTFTVTGTTAGCSADAVGNITVAPSPTVTVNSPIICSGQIATLTASGASSYTWSAGATATGSNTATAAPTVTTTYTVTGTSNGCTSQAIATVTVNNCSSPVANFAANQTVICESGCITFQDNSTNSPTNWLWLFPGGTPSTATSQNPGSICYDTLGAYSVTLIVSNANGIDSLTINNYINVVAPIPVTISGNLVTNGCESTELTASPAGQAYSWGPNVNISCATCQTATVAPNNTQMYYVNYVDSNGCLDGDTTTVVVMPLYNYFMPTAISPNGDGVNDELHVQGRGIQSIDLRIFNRQGTKVFDTTEMTKGWDGTFHGLALNNDVYTYSLIVTFCNGDIKKESGNITLIK